MQNLIRVRIADPAESPRIGQSPLQCVIFRRQRLGKRCQIRIEHFDAARVERLQSLFAHHHVQRRTPLRTGFGERQSSLFKIERGQVLAPSQLRSRWPPVQAPGNHQVQYQPKIALEPHRDALTDAAQLANFTAFDRRERRIHRAHQKRVAYPDQCERLLPLREVSAPRYKR